MSDAGTRCVTCGLPQSHLIHDTDSTSFLHLFAPVAERCAYRYEPAHRGVCGQTREMHRGVGSAISHDFIAPVAERCATCAFLRIECKCPAKPVADGGEILTDEQFERDAKIMDREAWPPYAKRVTAEARRARAEARYARHVLEAWDVVPASEHAALRAALDAATRALEFYAKRGRVLGTFARKTLAQIEGVRK